MDTMVCEHFMCYVLIDKLKTLITTSKLIIMTEYFKPEENRKDMKVHEGDNLIIPPKENTALTLSIRRKMDREVLSYIIQTLFQQAAQTPDEMSLILKSYYDYASTTLNDSILAEGLDTSTKEGISEFNSRVAANKNSSEWWAAQVIKEIKDLIDNTNIYDKETQNALWKMYKIATSHYMLTFKEEIESFYWSGYMVNNLKDLLKVWDENRENSTEDFWQNLFVDNPIILSQIFAFPVIFIKEKAYVGGKNLSNTGGNLVDFLFKNNLTKNTALVEIKTPKTKIIGNSYRSLYSISDQITGAIIQISNYKDSLTKEYRNLVENMEEEIKAFNPQCMVIAGNAQVELISKEQIKSFELFRSGLKDVQLITYDELFHKIEILIELIEEKNEKFF